MLPEGWIYDGKACQIIVDNKPCDGPVPNCPVGQIRVNGHCGVSPCPEGEVLQNNECVCGPGTERSDDGTCQTRCPPGSTLANGACTPLNCASDQILVNGHCVSPCPAGKVLYYGECVCAPGTEASPDGTCQTKCPPGSTLIDGSCSTLCCRPNPDQQPLRLTMSSRNNFERKQVRQHMSERFVLEGWRVYMRTTSRSG
jgi:hypothetical protein